MTKLTITIHSQDDPFIALARILEGRDTENLSNLTARLKQQSKIHFVELNNPVVTLEIVSDIWDFK